MGLCMHRNNPKGIKCTNPHCAGLAHADNHDYTHCYWPGGRMESMTPAWVYNKSTKSKTAAAAVATNLLSGTTPDPPPPPSAEQH